MPSVRSTTASSSPRAAHLSSENQYGRIMVHALGSVRRRLILTGPGEGSAGFRSRRSLPRSLATSSHPRLGALRTRAKAIERDASASRQTDREIVKGNRLKRPVARSIVRSHIVILQATEERMGDNR